MAYTIVILMGFKHYCSNLKINSLKLKDSESLCLPRSRQYLTRGQRSEKTGHGVQGTDHDAREERKEHRTRTGRLGTENIKRNMENRTRDVE